MEGAKKSRSEEKVGRLVGFKQLPNSSLKQRLQSDKRSNLIRRKGVKGRFCREFAFLKNERSDGGET